MWINELLKSVSLNATWLVTEKAVRALSTLFIGAWVIQHLGSEDFGHIAFGIAFVALFQSVSSLGIEGNLIREIVHTKHPKNRVESDGNYHFLRSVDFKTETLVSSVLALRLFAGLLLYFLCLALNGLLTNWDKQSMQITALIGFILIFQAADTIDIFNQSELASKRTAVAKIIAYLFSNGLRVYLIKADASLVHFAAAYFVEAIIVAVILVFYYRLMNSWCFSLGSAVRYLKFFIYETWPVIIAAVATAFATRMDQFFLKTYLGTEQIGLYAAAILFGSATFFLPAIICGSVMSTVTSVKINGAFEYRTLLRKIYVFNIFLALCISISTCFLAEFIILSFYGAEFEESVDALKVYAFLNIPVYVGITHSLWIVNDRKLHFLLYRAVVGAVLTISLCALLVPHHGMVGAAISILVSQCISEILVPYYLNQKQFNQILMRS